MVFQKMSHKILVKFPRSRSLCLFIKLSWTLHFLLNVWEGHKRELVPQIYHSLINSLLKTSREIGFRDKIYCKAYNCTLLHL